MELALKDGARTLENIEKARKDLDTIFSFINEKDPKAAAEIKSRLDLMANVLARDPQLAKSDLDNLFTALLAIHDQLFKK
jgi:plasmid stabilization system protein ParE